MPPTITYRIAGWADLNAIVELLHDDELGRARNPLLADAAQAYSDAFEHLIDQLDNDVIVGEADGHIVSCYQLTLIRGLSHTGGLRAQVESVRVRSDLRGTGVGSDMMQDAIARARARNCTLIQLTTDASRAGTKRFYERLGFVATHHGMKQFL